MQFFGIGRVPYRAQDMELQVPVSLLSGEFHGLDRVELSLARVEASGHQQVDFLPLQDRTDRQVVEFRVDAVLNDDDVLRDERLELLFDGLADADADVRVIHQLVDPFRPQEVAVVVLPQEVTEMAQVRQFQFSGGLHADTAEQ